ncbi:MAG: asparagine synthase (glutamine-hydrolyzing) [Clostridia bacterium]
MCGFVGFTDGDMKNYGIIRAMADRIKHRGPDDADYYLDDDISLGFRRLSIIDLNTGRQPILNENGTKVLVFNGEIYNFESLRIELIEKGHVFTTKTDSEVLLHGYEEWDINLLQKIRGMFAFVIWDKKKKEIFGARDFFGIKPFYYSQMKNTFMFASEIKAFLAHPNFTKELNAESLENYLSFQYSVGNDTFFKNVWKLPPAHYFIYKDTQIEIKRYWTPKFEPDDSKTLEYWTDEIKKSFKKSVEYHKITDVELGSFLSSGVDSSYVSATANIDKTFTVGFNYGEKYDETEYAKDLSEILNIKNISKKISTEEFWGNFSKIQYHMDEPLADPSAVALYFLCNKASEHLKVCLSGEGADELFGGYNVYTEPFFFEFYNKVPLFLRKAIGKIASLLPCVRGVNILVRRGKNLEERYIGNAYMFSEKERKNLLKIKTSAKKSCEILKPIFKQVKSEHDVTKMQYIDINTWLVGDILLKADKMSMANSLEVRVPFLDKEIFEVARKIPVKYKVNQNTTKIALRNSAIKKIPEKWANKKKLGFPIPTREWLKEDEYYNIVKKSFSDDIAEIFFDTKILLKLLDNHKNKKQDNSRKIWTVYTFLVWYKRFFVDEI